MNSPLSMFFKLGDKVTGGDPKKLMDWNYYMLWIMFIAFFSILVSNLYEFFFVSQRISSLGWAGVMFAILWFQYYGLKQTYEMRKAMKKMGNITSKPKEEEENLENEETVDEMMEGFKNESTK